MSQKFEKIYALLANREHGQQKIRKQNPVETLVLTILSQNTNDVNRDRAYISLRKTFPTWDSIARAKSKQLENSIRIAGLAKTKAKSIQDALRRIKKERGRYSLEHLRFLSLDASRSYLLSFKGVGLKTAAVVLCFAFQKPAFPVDTHIFRVSKRLGLIPEGTTIENAHFLLEKQIPTEKVCPAHLLLIRHGRETCHARKPECPGCVLQKICAYKEKTRA
ncbi:MAG: endonuclease III [Candidatus Micrarchaeota archaeon]